MKKTAEFKAGDIFRLVNPKGKLTTRQLIDGTDYPYVAAKKTENGIPKWCSAENIPEEQVMPGKCIVFVQQGDGAAGYATYQPVPFYAISCVCCGYIDNIDMTDEIGIYLMACLCKNKAFYSHSQSWSTAKIMDTPMILPVIESSDPHHVYTPSDIDWTYMEDHIRRLEEDHIRRLEKYLRVTGFENTILTPEEQEVLRKFRTGGVIFRKYRICELFDVKTTYSFNKNSINIYSEGNIDFIGRSSVNNGIQGKCKRESVNPNPANTFSIVQVGESVCLFREREWYASQNIFIMYPKDSDLSRTHLFVQAAVNKILGQMYKSAYVYPKLNDIKNLEISLPCLQSGDPDYALMETYIRAIEKQAVSRLNDMQKEEEKITKKITKG